MVRAKFYVRSKSVYAGSDGVTVEMAPVMSGSDENKAFFKATPGGEIKVYTVNGAAAAALELGAEYYVDFTRADMPAEAEAEAAG